MHVIPIFNQITFPDLEVYTVWEVIDKVIRSPVDTIFGWMEWMAWVALVSMFILSSALIGDA